MIAVHLHQVNHQLATPFGQLHYALLIDVVQDFCQSTFDLNLVKLLSGGEHEYTLYGFRQLLEKRAVDVVQFDTNRVGGITQAHKICALAEAFQIPVIPHAGQVHNFHISMSSINAPIVEYFPFWPVEIGNELFWYIFDGEPQAKNGFIELDENKFGLGIELSNKYLDNFEITE